jgi:hypothetical protein
MDTTRITPAERILKGAYRDEVRRTVLRESLARYRNEMLDDEERQELQDRIGRLRRSLRLDNGR